MRELRYRQAIYTNGKFRGFHFWGFSKGGFTAPETGVSSVEEATKNSGQFTGLRDSRGVEIYEGDVYLWRDKERGEVVYGHACFDCKSAKGRWSLESMVKDLVVIGNIHENPDLLDSPKITESVTSEE